MENSIQVSQNVKNWMAVWSSNLTSEDLFKENKSTNVKRYMKSNVCCSAIYSSQEVEATEGSANRWMNKQTVVRVSVQFSSLAQSCPTLCDPMDCSTPGLPVHHQLLEFTQTHVIELVMPSNHLIFCCPLLHQPLIFPNIRVFTNESVLHIRWSKYWSFSFSVSPSNESSGLISFRMDWLDLLAVQGTLKNLLQYHSSKASILQCSAFFIVQLSTWQLEKP